MLTGQTIPAEYYSLSKEEIFERIGEHKRRFGRRLVVLGHHYQSDDVLQFADLTGDSLKLSQLAAEQTEAEFVVFCGVHFMAETADILTGEEVKVILPDVTAGCGLAEAAEIGQVEAAWRRLTGATDASIVPITYVNSTAAVKAFVGRHDGACCTSGNARQVVEWALQRGGKLFFLPDEHLGRNASFQLGVPLERMVVYDPAKPAGGLTDEQIRRAKVILWGGCCSVHQFFTVGQCDTVRAADASFRIVVHPECRWEVVQCADFAGGTEFIIRVVAESPAGSKWAVGTEFNLVNRLAEKWRGQKVVVSLSPFQCLCETMGRIDVQHLLWVLDNLAAGRVVNQIRVDGATRRDALVAVQRMLELKSAGPVGVKG